MRLTLLLLSMAALVSCQHPSVPTQEEKGLALMERSRELACRRQYLQHEIFQTWDQVSAALADKLPSTMKGQERKNMILIRNADLIRMFKVYPALDTSIHHLVDQAERKDLRLAQEIRSLEAMQQQHDLEIQAFLIEIRSRSAGTYKSWLDSMALARLYTCMEQGGLQAGQ